MSIKKTITPIIRATKFPPVPIKATKGPGVPLVLDKQLVA